MLAPGSTVGICAPSGSTRPERLAAGIQALQAAGLQVKVGASLYARSGYVAGADAGRAADLNAMVADPQVDVILAARGGFGAGRLLPLLDLAPLRERPKPIVGFSDVTALHLAWRRAGVPSTHGPMAEDAAELPSLLDRLREPAGPVVQPDDGPPLVALVPGAAEGILVGGNLSLLAAACGTPWQLQADGAIVLVEDLHEAPYRIDRMLTQLAQAGALRGLRGAVVGELIGCDPPAEGGPFPTPYEVFAARFAEMGVPCFAGLACGHGKRRLAVPLGLRAQMDAGSCLLEVLG
ncbi:MAG TPA: LD-carboxypeptidase [Bacillota bacterium]|nr:LD-carboxypeptidase [Bacillota bacterium]